MARNIIDWQRGHGDTAEMKEGPARNYTRSYYATLRSVRVDPFYIFQFKDCPQLGERHEKDKAAYCFSVKLNQVGSTAVWKAVCEWTTDIENPKHDPNPLKRPAEIDITGGLKQVATVVDGLGLPIINTAGDLEVRTIDKPIQNIRVQKNVAKVPYWFWWLPGSVNKFAVKIEKHRHLPRTLKLLPPHRAKLTLENGKWFYPLDYTLEQDEDTHDEIDVSRGFHELVPEIQHTKNGPVTRLIKKRITVGTPPEYPKEKQFLDKHGRALILDPDNKGGIDLKKIHVIRRRILPEKNLNRLPLK